MAVETVTATANVVEHADIRQDSVVDDPEDDGVLKVRKRDGRVVDFDPDNIVSAIGKAFADVDGVASAQDTADAGMIAARVESRMRSMYPDRPVDINEIQNLVEHALLDAHHYDVATAYKDYRWKRDVQRAKQTDANEAVKRFIRKDKDIIDENANKDGKVFSTQRDLLAGAISKSAALQMLPRDVSNAHAKCDIHFHDADYSPFTTMTNCFARDTRFVTSKGVASFEDFSDGDEITVLTPTGKWRHAVVRSHGVQPLNEITFVRNNRTRITIEATPDHRWILHDGTETTALRAGDRLVEVSGDTEFSNADAWAVESIAAANRIEIVWCLEVDEEHAFVLDGGIPTGNCSLPDFASMLRHGFALGNAEMGSPNSIETAATQITQIMLDVASSQYGGQTLNRADEVLAPYAKKNYTKNLETAEAMFPDGADIDAAWDVVRRIKDRERTWLHITDRAPIPDDTPFHEDAPEIERVREVYAKILTRKNIYDAMQTLEYQVNTQHATCGQTPFVTVGFGLGTSWFEREVSRCILLIRIGGLGRDHRTAIFPKLTYTIKHGVNSESTDPSYDLKQLALECTSKRMYPDILFYENIEKITGSFKAPMGCRSFLQGWVNPDTGEDEEEGRMNLGVVTLNIPRIAIESKGNMRKFHRLFEQRLEVAHHALQFRIKRCAETIPANAPVLWENGAFGRLEPGGSVDSLLNRSRSTVSLGYIGLYEATAMFFGREWVNDFGWDDEARDFAIGMLRRMTEACREWEDAEGYHYSVYGTPSESLTDRFSRADREKFGVIAGITDHDFYTNSFHRPVWLSGMDDHEPTEAELDVMARPRFHRADNGGPFSKLDFEQPFLKYTAGGHIVYTEEPRLVQNTAALEAVWDYAHSIGIDYLGTNTPIDRCYKCGYEGDFDPTDTGYKCPMCGNEDPTLCDVTKRVCGYLGNPQARPMIHGRHEELIHRRKQLQGETGRIVLKNGSEKAFYKDRSLDISQI